MQGPSRQEDQSSPAPNLHRAPPRPTSAADRPWPALLGRADGAGASRPDCTSSSGQAGAVNTEPQDTRRGEREEQRNCTLRCVGMNVTLPEMSERSASFSWVEIALRSMIDAGISEEVSISPEGLLLQELRILDDIAIRYRGIQGGSCRSLAAEIGHEDSNRCGVFDDTGEQAAFKAAGLPFLVSSDLFTQSARTTLAKPLSAATPEEL